jgi:hypothetical protein
MVARRWEPITGTIAAAMGVSADLARSAADTVVKPVKAYQQRDTMELEEHTDSTNATAVLSSNDQISSRVKHTRGCLSTTKSLTVVSAHSMSRFLTQFARGLVIIPFAFTEGFRNVPLLYGEELRDYGEIYDWKSGIVFGAKAVVFGMVDGVGGLFILPYKGAKQQGVVGAAKGVGKGIAGLSSKLFTGMLTQLLRVRDSDWNNPTATIGSATYPLQGLYKSIWRLANSKARRSVQQARLAEGRYMADRSRVRGVSDRVMMDTFDAMMTGNIRA